MFKIKSTILFISILVFLFSCKKEENEPSFNKYKIYSYSHYQFTNMTKWYYDGKTEYSENSSEVKRYLFYDGMIDYALPNFTFRFLSDDSLIINEKHTTYYRMRNDTVEVPYENSSVFFPYFILKEDYIIMPLGSMTCYVGTTLLGIPYFTGIDFKTVYDGLKIFQHDSLEELQPGDTIKIANRTHYFKQF